MKGVALIDGRSRPYFKGIERVLNSQQRDALAQGVWQVLETIPDDFDSFEFQFAGTQVYIHKLSQELILLVLTHDSLNYPDYADAFGQLRQAFDQDRVETTEVFQRLLGSRNTKLAPVDLTDMAAPPDVSLPDLPSGSADYAVAADTELTDVSVSAQAPDAPANPAPADLAGSAKAGQPGSPPVTQAGAWNGDGSSAGDDIWGDRSAGDSPWEVSASEGVSDAADGIWAGNSGEPAELPEMDLPPEPESLLAVTPIAPVRSEPSPAQSPDQSNIAARHPRADKHQDLAALMDTLSLGEDDFDEPAADEPAADEPAAAAQPGPAAAKREPSVAAARSQPEPPPAAKVSPGQPPAPVAPALDDAWAREANALADALESSAAPFVGEEPMPAAEPLRLAPTPPGSARAGSAIAAPASSEDELDLDSIFRDDSDGEAGELLLGAPAAAPTPALESYVDALNALGEFSTHYLGRAVIVNYWRTSRSGDDWLQAAFAIERAANSIRLSPDYAASRQSPVTPAQQELLQAWAAQFVDRCSRVIRDFSQLAQASLNAEQVERLGL